MNAIHDRFNLAVKYLLDNDIAKNQKEIAVAVGQKPNNFREILKGRVRLHADVLDSFLEKYPVNPLFLHSLSEDIEVRETLNKGETDQLPFENSLLTQPPIKSIDTLQLTRALKSDTISNEERRKIADELEDIIATLQDDNSILKSSLISFINAEKSNSL